MYLWGIVYRNHVKPIIKGFLKYGHWHSQIQIKSFWANYFQTWALICLRQVSSQLPLKVIRNWTSNSHRCFWKCPLITSTDFNGNCKYLSESTTWPLTKPCLGLFRVSLPPPHMLLQFWYKTQLSSSAITGLKLYLFLKQIQAVFLEEFLWSGSNTKASQIGRGIWRTVHLGTNLKHGFYMQSLKKKKKNSKVSVEWELHTEFMQQSDSSSHHLCTNT